MLINKIYKKILLFLFPKKCIGCGLSDFWICEKCIKNLPKIYSTPEDFIHPIFNYRDKNVKKIIWFLKFNKKHSVLEDLENEIIKEFDFFLEKNKIKKNDFVLIPIPITKRSLNKRGYNQSEFIAKTLNQDLVNSNILYKKTNHISQNKIKNKNERKNNIKNSFEVKNKNKIKNKVLILIDDVTTTGATILEARKILKNAGAKKVYGFTLAH
ncbi:MAG: competence protein ComFC [Patescibacteria group bacterium]|jgi:competence protein ComFC|nr:competence protein ComFC [Patescibacteria group bacterium]